MLLGPRQEHDFADGSLRLRSHHQAHQRRTYGSDHAALRVLSRRWAGLKWILIAMIDHDYVNPQIAAQ
jgi:hypothetical protein